MPRYHNKHVETTVSIAIIYSTIISIVLSDTFILLETRKSVLIKVSFTLRYNNHIRKGY